MKKIMILTMIGISLLFSGCCGEMDIWTANRARIKVDDNKWEEVKVIHATHIRPYDGCDIVSVETEDKVYVTHSANVILIKDKR